MSSTKDKRTPNPPPDGRERILAAALHLIRQRGEASVSMADIAQAARLSRQAVYLHFADRADLMVALARYVDEQRGLAREIRKITGAPDGRTALREAVSLQARMNPGLWAVARALDSVRRTDPDAERAWQDRLASRMEGALQIVAHLARDGQLRPGLNPKAAAALLWSTLSLHTWEDLVLDLGWSAEHY